MKYTIDGKNALRLDGGWVSCPLMTGGEDYQRCNAECAQFEYREAVGRKCLGNNKHSIPTPPQAILHCCNRTIDLGE